MQIFKLSLLSLLGFFILSLGWMGWIGLLDNLATLYPTYQELLQNPKLKQGGLIIGLFIVLAPAYLYGDNGSQVITRFSKKGKQEDTTKSIWDIYSPKGITLQILLLVMVTPIAIMIQLGFLFIPDFIFSSNTPDILKRFTNFVCQKFHLTEDMGAYLVVIAPSLISASLFYLLGGKKWLSTPRSLFRPKQPATNLYLKEMAKSDREYVAKTINDFLNDENPNPYTWDELISSPKPNKTYQLVCNYLDSTRELYPSNFGWCNVKGTEKLKEFSKLLASSTEDKNIHKFIKNDQK